MLTLERRVGRTRFRKQTTTVSRNKIIGLNQCDLSYWFFSVTVIVTVNGFDLFQLMVISVTVTVNLNHTVTLVSSRDGDVSLWPWGLDASCLKHSHCAYRIPIQWLHMISYYSPIITTSPSCTVFEILPQFCQNMKRSRDLGHAPFGGSMSSVDYYSPRPISVPNLKCLVSPSPEMQKEAHLYPK